MHHSTLRLTTLATNKAHSAGIVLSAAGEKGQRYAYPEADFLIHSPSYTVNGKFTLKRLKEEYDKKARAEQRYISLLAMLTGNDKEKIEELFSGDNYMNAEEAKDLGIIDHIIPPIR